MIDNISCVQPRDFLYIELGEQVCFGIVSSVNDQSNTVTFSKLDVLVKGTKNRNSYFKGILEGMTINFSTERFNNYNPHRYFGLCRSKMLQPNFTIEDFFRPGDFIETGVTWSKDRIDWSIVGIFNRVEEIERGFHGGQYQVLFVDNPMLCRGRELSSADNGAKRLVTPFVLSSRTRLIKDDVLKERFMTYETCKDYTIQGLLV